MDSGAAEAAGGRVAAGRMILTLDRVGRTFDGGSIVALKDASLAIGDDELVAIHGPSGSGKSTLINLLAGLDRPTSGLVSFAGRPSPTPGEWARLRATRLGIVFQDFNLLPTLTAAENVELAMFGHGLNAAERRRRASARLAEAGVAHCAGRLAFQLSGGERQRVGVARSLANDPELLLADEPTSNLDSVSGAAVTDLLLETRRSRRMSLVIVTHDAALIARCPRRVRLADGEIVEDTAAERGRR
jgi:ABC-type lipoprotein export system ATPase subunit